MPSRARAFCITINNPTDDDDLQTIYESEHERQLARMQFIVGGHEVGESGTPHLQVFVYFENGRTPLGIKRLKGFSRAHIQICHDRSPGYSRAIDYCRKGEQSHEEWDESGVDGANFGRHARVFSYGQSPQQQGARNDITRAIEILQTNNFDLNRLARLEPEMYVRHYRGFEALRERLDSNVRNSKTEVIWIYGPTGVGKSRFVGELMSAGLDVYWKVPTHKWFNQYAHQPVMCLDDYRKGGGYLLFNDMLRLFDRYPLQVEWKGGCTQFLSKYIIVTSCQSPTQLWDGQTDERIDQLLRRIEHTVELPNAVSTLRLNAIRRKILDTCGIINEIPVNDLPQTEIEGEYAFNNNRD